MRSILVENNKFLFEEFSVEMNKARSQSLQFLPLITTNSIQLPSSRQIDSPPFTHTLTHTQTYTYTTSTYKDRNGSGKNVTQIYQGNKKQSTNEFPYSNYPAIVNDFFFYRFDDILISISNIVIVIMTCHFRWKYAVRCWSPEKPIKWKRRAKWLWATLRWKLSIRKVLPRLSVEHQNLVIRCFIDTHSFSYRSSPPPLFLSYTLIHTRTHASTHASTHIKSMCGRVISFLMRDRQKWNLSVGKAN